MLLTERNEHEGIGLNVIPSALVEIPLFLSMSLCVLDMISFCAFLDLIYILSDFFL